MYGISQYDYNFSKPKNIELTLQFDITEKTHINQIVVILQC